MATPLQDGDNALAVIDNPKSSRAILDALSHAEKEFRDYNELCRRIDAIYSARSVLTTTAQDMGLSDQEYDTFWASMEVLKPAIYAKAPQVVAKPRFSDATSTDKVVAELLERVVNSELERNGIDMHLREVRDDMALLNRGVLWVTYEVKKGRKSICVDHLDRLDYRHEPVRYWPELGWEARCAWMTEREMKERFDKIDDATIGRAGFATRSDWADDDAGINAKAPVWEVWSKTDNKVYWVTEGIDGVLDEGDPHLDLRDFYPAPRPAYGTLRRRTLVPVPDYIRYQGHLDQINELTGRIYALLGRVRMAGLVPAGGDIATAVEVAMRSNDDMIVIPVPGAAMLSGATEFVQWLPLDMLANTITGLISARQQLFADFDRLSGISDIMRGETEADETLGAQRLKGQYGSVRVKDKTEEIVRLARDVARVAVEIICDKFDQATLLDISQMTIPTRKHVEHDIDELKKAAKEELKALTKQGEEAAQQAQQQGKQVDPAQAQQQLQQAQQQIAAKYAPQLQTLTNTVVIEDVMKVIRDRRDRALIIDIETDSTVMTDEFAEKQARTELLGAFSQAMGALQPLFAIGEPGVKLAVSMLQFALQPYVRNNRQIQAQLDELIEQAPDIAAKMAAQNDKGDSDELAKAQQMLAQAEQVKAQAAMAGVQAKAQADQAANQAKMAELQQRANDAQQAAQHQMQALQQKAQVDSGKLQHENSKLQVSVAQLQTEAQQSEQKLAAEIDNLRAQTYQILVQAGIAQDQAALGQFKTVEDVHAKRTDQAMGAVNSLKDGERQDRAQSFAEKSATMGGE